MRTKSEVATKENVMNFNSLTQDDIPAFLAKVNEQILALTGGKKAEVLIDKPFFAFGKIQDINTVKGLIEAYSSLSGKKEAFDKAAKAILPESIKAPSFNVNGFGFEAWSELIKSRVIEVAHEAELKKLQQIKTKLEENLSAKDKLAKDLSAIANLLSLNE